MDPVDWGGVIVGFHASLAEEAQFLELGQICFVFKNSWWYSWSDDGYECLSKSVGATERWFLLYFPSFRWGAENPIVEKLRDFFFPATSREVNFSTICAVVTKLTMDTTPLLPMLMLLG